MSSPLDMLMGGVGNAATWAGGIAPVKPVTDQSDHYNGGAASSAGSNSVAPDAAKRVLHMAAGIVIVALVLLWLMGAFPLRSGRL